MKKSSSWYKVFIILGAYLLFRFFIKVAENFGLFSKLHIHSFVWLQTILEILIIVYMILINHYFIRQMISYDIKIKNSFLVLLPVVLLLLMFMASISESGSDQTYAYVLPLPLAAGFFEEYLCRGLLLPQILKSINGIKKVESKNVYLAVFFSSLIFACLHFFNLASQDLVTTCLQVWFALCAGVFFSSLYVSSESIIPSFLFHFLYDYLSMYTNGPAQQKVSVNYQTILSISISTIFFLGYSWLLINKNKLKKRSDWLSNLINN
ncbi:CPBP family intramembrane glutamic endopeptidase [Xylocopilactobacillus apis]|uniref:CPBP family intramembrane glutamic endopeptidase n=1 Tax=Xylocopilactobacillus apis TaxID=2932183 RepID=UPI002955A5B0|nr:CPBP family intramembrane glutamic endopeptidase [Xylocopilactobacillus apis]